MQSVQTILANQNATVNVTTDVYISEQRNLWSVDFMPLTEINSDLLLTMQVSNDTVNWFEFKIIKEKVRLSKSFMYNQIPFDYIRFIITGNATKGTYKLLFNERD